MCSVIRLVGRIGISVCLLISWFWPLAVQAEAVEVFYGPGREYRSKTWIGSDTRFDVQAVRYGWVYIKGWKVEGWVLADDLEQAGLLGNRERIALASDERFSPWRVEGFWWMSGGWGASLYLPWRDSGLGLAGFSDIWPGDSENWTFRYHRSDTGLEAWQMLTLGIDSEMARIGRWRWHAWVGGGLGINEEYSRHWDDQGAAIALPVAALAVDFRRLLRSGFEIGARVEANQALAGNQALYGGVSLFWLMRL